MEIGITHRHPDSAADPAQLASHADALGFESYRVAGHAILPMTFSDTYPGVAAGQRSPHYLWQIPDSLMVLAQVSGVTTGIALGTGICRAPERHPIVLAQQIASLGEASGGCVRFGIGSGWNGESRIWGGDFEHRRTQLKDPIAAMKEQWTEEVFHGVRFRRHCQPGHGLTPATDAADNVFAQPGGQRKNS